MRHRYTRRGGGRYAPPYYFDILYAMIQTPQQGILFASIGFVCCMIIAVFMYTHVLGKRAVVPVERVVVEDTVLAEEDILE